MKARIIIGIYLVFLCSFCQAQKTMDFRGVVYDVGLKFTPESCSVDTFDIDLVKYDMSIIANILRANAVRIEGEDIHRLAAAAEAAHAAGLKIFFNPWKMNADEKAVTAYMAEAAKAAEELRRKGMDLVFITGCEYSVFDEGVFEGRSINERLNTLMSFAQIKDKEAVLKAVQEKNRALNRILANICRAVRANYSGPLTYSSGTWENVDWNLFDLVGVDYYRDIQSDEEYLKGLRPYFGHGKPVFVMEVGCCTYEGAARRGGSGFTILQGTTPDGKTGIYEGGTTPVRSEKEQADYIQTQIELLNGTGIQGMFIYLFSYPIYPYRTSGLDLDMTGYAIVKTYAKDQPRARMLPPWEPKEAFYRLAEIYRRLEQTPLIGQ